MTHERMPLNQIAEMIERLSVEDRAGHLEANGRLYCELNPAERRFIAISPGGEPWGKYDGSDRKTHTMAGLVFERVDWRPGTEQRTGGRIQQFHSSPQYTRSLDKCERLCAWVLLHASDIGADGMALVRLGNPSNSAEMTGVGSTLATAWAAACCRAIAHDRAEEAEAV